MKSILFALAGLILAATTLRAQPPPQKTSYRNFPIVLTLQFHLLSYPLKDLQDNFTHPGIGLGTEIALGSRHEWSQQFTLLWYHNGVAGDGWGFYTQSAWRPTITGHVYTGLQAGFGLIHSFRPGHALQEVDGVRTRQGRRGKWMPVIPLGATLGYNRFSPDTYADAFVGYQLMVMGGYNKDFPVIPNTFIQMGSALHVQK